MTNRDPILPGSRRVQVKEELLPVGTLVRLKNAPHGEEGIVTGSTRHKVVIRWPSLNFTGKYRPESLIVVGAAKKEPVASPVPPKLNPYDRLLAKLGSGQRT